MDTLESLKKKLETAKKKVKSPEFKQMKKDYRKLKAKFDIINEKDAEEEWRVYSQITDDGERPHMAHPAYSQSSNILPEARKKLGEHIDLKVLTEGQIEDIFEKIGWALLKDDKEYQRINKETTALENKVSDLEYKIEETKDSIGELEDEIRDWKPPEEEEKVKIEYEQKWAKKTEKRTQRKSQYALALERVPVIAKGWHSESMRHALASKGIKTGRK